MKTTKEILLENIMVLKARIIKRGKGITAQVTIPPRIIKQHNINNKEEIIIAYLGKPEKNDEN